MDNESRLAGAIVWVLEEWFADEEATPLAVKQMIIQNSTYPCGDVVRYYAALAARSNAAQRHARNGFTRLERAESLLRQWASGVDRSDATRQFLGDSDYSPTDSIDVPR